MSTKTFRAKARDLEQVTRNYDNAPACDVDSEDRDPRTEDDQASKDGLRPPIRLVIRPRPARRRAA